MKTFVILFSMLFGNSLDFTPTKVNECQNKIRPQQNPSESDVLMSSFDLLTGNSQSNSFKKTLRYQNYYYVIGSNGVRASLHKLDLNGGILWSREVSDTSSWNDFIINESGNILAIGSRDISATLPRDVLVGVFDLNGNQLRLLSYDYGINESYNSIVANPLRITAANRYLVVGSINLTNNRNDDDVIVTTMDEWGITSSWRRSYGSLSFDDEFHSRITVYNPVLGQFALSGQMSGNGLYVVIDNNGSVTNLGRTFGVNSKVTDVQRTPAGEFLIAGSFSGQSQIIKVSTVSANNFIFRNSSYTSVQQIIPTGSGNFYALATGNFSGIVRPVFLNMADNASILNLNQIRYADGGETAFTNGSMIYDAPTLVYVDGRVNTIHGFGNFDGYITNTIGTPNECGLKELDNSFTRLTYNQVIAQPVSRSETLRSPFELTSVFINYFAKRICSVSNCLVEFSVQQDSCGKVQFSSYTNLSAPLNYCWDFGDAPPCGSTLQNPTHQYNFPGTYVVCLTVSNASDNCKSCRNITILKVDRTPPSIMCPPSITVDCHQNTTPPVTGYPVVTDLIDPAPVIGYTDFIIIATKCYKEFIRNWYARDYCGNTIHCQQKIVQKDLSSPIITCPPDISLECTAGTSPEHTGFPVITDNCQSVFLPRYIDSVVNESCPLIIHRTWVVEDSCGNQNSCHQVIYQDDNTPPDLSHCFRKFTSEGTIGAQGNCSKYMLIPPPSFADNCDPAPVLINDYNLSADASDIYPEGITLIKWILTDHCGNTSSCIDTVCVIMCPCNDTCSTNVLNISTGWDPIDDVLLPVGAATSQWLLVESPTIGSGISNPTSVIAPHPSWATHSGSQWISAYPFSNYDVNNPHPEPAYSFQNCFCVCEDSSFVTIDLKAYADDNVKIILFDPATSSNLSNLLAIPNVGTTAFDGTVQHSSSTSLYLNAGRYCIVAGLRNIDAVAMGINIEGTVTGAGLIESVCCGVSNFISGNKFLDKKCNGQRDPGDPPGVGFSIQLKDAGGVVIATSLTDADGFFYFQNISPGTYTVCEELQPGYIQSFPVSGQYNITVVDNHSVINKLDFGNCPLSTCCVDESAFLDFVSTPLDILRDSCSVCIIHPCLNNCQRLMVHWGDGSTSPYYTGIGSAQASHTYAQSGEYTICILYEELNEQGEVCFQKDSCFTVCVECSSCIEKDLFLTHKTILGIDNQFTRYTDVRSDNDENGNIYAGGAFVVSNPLLGTPSGLDGYVVQYNSSLIPNWALQFYSSAMTKEIVRVVKYDEINDVLYVGGNFNSANLKISDNGTAGTISFTHTPGTISPNGEYSFVAKLLINSSTGLPSIDWVYSFEGGGNGLQDLDLTSTGNIVVATNISASDLNNSRIIVLNPSGSEVIPLTKVIISGTEWNQIFSISVGNNDDIFIGGEFFGDIEFAGGTSFNSVSPTMGTGAGFVAKFNSSTSFQWAFPLLSPNRKNTSLPWTLQADLNNSIFIGGSFNTFNGGPLNFHPLGGTIADLSSLTPSGDGFIGKYNQTSGELIWVKQSNFDVYESDLDEFSNLYVAGVNEVWFSPPLSLDLNIYTGPLRQKFFYESVAAIYNPQGELLKGTTQIGSNRDEIWSITALGNGDFLTAGKFNSQDFELDPLQNSDIDLTSTSIPGDGKMDIYLAKYACECVAFSETQNICCDKIIIEVEEINMNDTTCCYTTHVSIETGFSIKNVDVNILTPGWSFGTLSVAAGLNHSGTATQQNVFANFGNLPGFYTADFFSFCLNGDPGAANEQLIEFVWYEKLKSGACIATCRDTIKTSCLAPVMGKDCLHILESEISCNPYNPYEYCLTFNVNNLSSFIATGISLVINSPGFGLHSCTSSGYYNPFEIDFDNPINLGEISNEICVKITSTSPILNPSEICFEFALLFGDTSICFQDSQYCFTILPCCDPCEKVEISTQKLFVKDSCCYSLTIENLCAYQFFNRIEICLPTGVEFISYTPHPAWSFCAIPNSDLICLKYNAGYIPPGILNDVLSFCLDGTGGFTSSLMVKFYSDLDQYPKDTLVCVRTSEISCTDNCYDNLVKNGNFQDGLIGGDLGTGGSVNFWVTQSNTPQVIVADGCQENGSIRMWGNQAVGESISQSFAFNPLYLYEISYCARRFADPPKLDLGRVRMRATNNPGIYGVCAAPVCEDILISPVLSTIYTTYTTTYRPSRMYSNLLISSWNPSNTNHGDSTSWIGIDDVCIRIIDSCRCVQLNDLKIYNNEFTITAGCNATIPMQIPCSVNNNSFNLMGSLICSDSCSKKLDWQIEDSYGTIVLSGSITTGFSGAVWNINNILYSHFNSGEVYYFKANGICGADTCICSIPFIVESCGKCCSDSIEFSNLINSAIHLDFDNKLCKAKLRFDSLPCNMQILYVNWRDGFISNGPFFPGSMVMHVYAPAQLSYLVQIMIVEYDDQGRICNQKLLTKPVSLNCKKCCDKKNYNYWKSLVAQGFQVNVSGCKVTVTAPQFSDCHYFESVPDFGEFPPQPPPATIPTGGSWSYTYSNSGTYTICVVVSEYPNGDTSLDPCWTKLMCTPVTVSCDSVCMCRGFTNLSFHWNKADKRMVSCSDTITLECPPDDCAWTFSGNLLCKNNCPFSTVDWTLIQTSTGSIVANGSTISYPGFGIYIPQSIVEQGGEYDLKLSGNCGNAQKCVCSIHIIFPGCDEICPCDPQDFIADVEAGISTISILNDCIACFRPKKLQECDQVNWYLLPNLNQPFASSLANQMLCHDFGRPGLYRIKMDVVRLNEDGSICYEYEKIMTIQVNCTSINPLENIINNCNQQTMAEDWLYISGNRDYVNSNNKTTQSLFSLKGNEINSDIIVSKINYCLNPKGSTLRLRFKIEDKHKIKHGSRLLVGLMNPKDINKTNQIKNSVLVLDKLELEGLPEKWIEYTLNIDLLDPELFEHCIFENNFFAKVVLYLENDLGNNILNSFSEILIDNICVVENTSTGLSDKLNSIIASVQPNPSHFGFDLILSGSTAANCLLEVYDNLGNRIETLDFDLGQNIKRFGQSYAPALYYLKVTCGNKTEMIKIVKISN